VNQAKQCLRFIPKAHVDKKKSFCIIY